MEYFDISDQSAMRTYVRSLCFLLAKAVDDIMPKSQVYFEHAISKGYYFYIKNGHSVTKDDLQNIKARMREIVNADIPFLQIEEEKDEVITKNNLFES